MANPNPMNARCGLEGCDCGYTIDLLLRALVVVRDAWDAELADIARRAIDNAQEDK